MRELHLISINIHLHSVLYYYCLNTIICHLTLKSWQEVYWGVESIESTLQWVYGNLTSQLYSRWMLFLHRQGGWCIDMEGNKNSTEQCPTIDHRELANTERKRCKTSPRSSCSRLSQVAHTCSLLCVVLYLCLSHRQRNTLSRQEIVSVQVHNLDSLKRL